MGTIRLIDRIKISAQAIFWFILASLFAISCPLVLGVSFWLTLLCFLIGTLVSVPLFFLYKHYSGFATRFTWFKFALAISMLNVVILAFPVFYFAYVTEAKPLVLPQVTLSNGNKTVIFQGMVHVGSASFYKSVVYDLENALADGYVLFYEGVQPSDTEADSWFSDSMSGGQDLSENYQKLSDICGVQFQLNFFTLLAKQQLENPEQHVTADVTTRQMLDQWNALVRGNPELESKRKVKMEDSNSADIMSWLNKQSDERKKIGGIFCRALLTHSLDKPNEPDALSPVVLDFRNQKLAEKIIESDSDKIYITYGAAHLPGLISELQSVDEAWQVRAVKWVRALQTERTYTGDESFFLPEE